MIQIDVLELLALKKLALINGALAKSLKDASAAREQRMLTEILIGIINRAELSGDLGQVAESRADRP